MFFTPSGVCGCGIAREGPDRAANPCCAGTAVLFFSAVDRVVAQTRRVSMSRRKGWHLWVMVTPSPGRWRGVAAGHLAPGGAPGCGHAPGAPPAARDRGCRAAGRRPAGCGDSGGVSLGPPFGSGRERGTLKGMLLLGSVGNKRCFLAAWISKSKACLMARRLPVPNQARAFGAVARHLGFKIAAEELDVTQPVVSAGRSTRWKRRSACVFSCDARARPA